MYLEDGKDDVGVLKSVLPLMARHATGYHPISYTVWYEYAKGTNLPLRQAVDAELQYQERLNGAQTYAIYCKYLVDPAESAVFSTRSDLLGLVSDVKETVRDANARTAGLDNHLAHFQRGVQDAKTLAEVQGSVTSILAETRRAKEGFGKISEHLEESKAVVERLTEELQTVSEEARTDALSGLLNRRGFDRELTRMSPAPGSTGTLALVMLDIDNFKKVNDTYGHPLGDAVIAAVGHFIRDTVQGIGVGARYGGEEFAVLMPAKDVDAAEKLAEKIRQRVEQGKIKRRQGDEPIGGITVSAGVAGWKTGDDGAALVERADAMLYAAKHAGRNRVHVER